MKLVNPEIRIENCSMCNSKCTLCPRELMTRKQTTMPLKHFKGLVDEAKTLGATTVSVFGFGEPLIDATITKKISYCTTKGLDTFITTNASLLDVNMASYLLNAGLKHIRFSVHGLHPETYERIHRGLKFSKVMRNIYNFLAMNNMKYDGVCKTSVTIIPTAGESVEEIREYWEDKVTWLEVWKPHGWAGKRDYREKPTNKTGKLKSCNRPFSGPIQIQADGTMIPCCFLTDSEIVLGTTYENSIEEILKGEKYEKLRRAHKRGTVGRYPCANCDQLNKHDEPLIYSNRDGGKGFTSSIKFNLGD